MAKSLKVKKRRKEKKIIKFSIISMFTEVLNMEFIKHYKMINKDKIILKTWI